MKTMVRQDPIHTALVVICGILATSMVASPVDAQRKDANQLTARQIVERSRAAYAALASYHDEGTVRGTTGDKAMSLTFTTQLSRPGLYRLDWRIGAREGATWSSGTGNFLRLNDGNAQMETANLQQSLSLANPLSLEMSVHVPAMFFSVVWNNEPWPNATSVHRKPDEEIDGFDCYVLTLTTTATTTIWYSKKDLLVRQIERDIDGGKTSAALHAREKEHPGSVPKEMSQTAISNTVLVERHFNIVVNQNIPKTDFEP